MSLNQRRNNATLAVEPKLQQAYENGLAARSNGRRANPFEDPYGIDWSGRQDYAAAWNLGRAAWEAQARPALLQEVRVEDREHRRRVLEHQQRVEAEQRAQAAQPFDPQLKIPLIGEVKRVEPPPPKRRRTRTTKPNQPKLAES